MKPPGRESRPGLASGAALTTIDATNEIIISVDRLDDMALQLNGGFAVVVQIAEDRRRRKVYLTVAAAEAACRRAEDRGHAASIYLVELRPVYKVAAGPILGQVVA